MVDRNSVRTLRGTAHADRAFAYRFHLEVGPCDRGGQSPRFGVDGHGVRADKQGSTTTGRQELAAAEFHIHALTGPHHERAERFLIQETEVGALARRDHAELESGDRDRTCHAQRVVDRHDRIEHLPGCNHLSAVAEGDKDFVGRYRIDKIQDRRVVRD